MLKEGIRPEMVDGLLSAQTHCSQIDTEGYRLNVMQALDIAEGKMAAATTAPPTLNLQILSQAMMQTQALEEDLVSSLSAFKRWTMEKMLISNHWFEIGGTWLYENPKRNWTR